MSTKKMISLSVIFVLIIVLVLILVGMNLFREQNVYFDSQGGVGVAAQKINYGEKVEMPPNPVMDGYLFEGWYLGEEEFDFDTPIKEDITLVGKWKGVIIFEQRDSFEPNEEELPVDTLPPVEDVPNAEVSEPMIP